MAVNAKARVAQSIGFCSITAAAKCSVTFESCFSWWKARLLGWWGSSCAMGTAGAVTLIRPSVRTGAPSPLEGKGSGGRPHGAAPTVFFRTYSERRVREAAPYSLIRTIACSTKPGAAVGPHQPQFLQTQGPVAREKLRRSLRFCAPEIPLIPTGTRPP